VPGPSPVRRAPEERGKPFRAGAASTIAAARAGGRARRFHTKLASCVGLETTNKTWRRCVRDAEAARRACLAQIAATVGGGQVGTAVQIRVAASTIAEAASRLAYQAGDLRLGARLAQAARQDMIVAYELAAREAEARESAGHDPAAGQRALIAAFGSASAAADGSDEP
jgi:hypothetical protein